MAINLPSIADKYQSRLQLRVADNLSGDAGDKGYARWWAYPTSATVLRDHIELAHDARFSKGDLINNSRDRMIANLAC
jgi:hypothetical protein